MAHDVNDNVKRDAERHSTPDTGFCTDPWNGVKSDAERHTVSVQRNNKFAVMMVMEQLGDRAVEAAMELYSANPIAVKALGSNPRGGSREAGEKAQHPNEPSRRKTK